MFIIYKYAVLVLRLDHLDRRIFSNHSRMRFSVHAFRKHELPKVSTTARCHTFRGVFYMGDHAGGLDLPRNEILTCHRLTQTDTTAGRVIFFVMPC